MDRRTIIFITLMLASFYVIQLIFPKPSPPKVEAVVQKQELKKADEKKEPLSRDTEKFYVLENDFQMLVFSNIGGSIAEINLPVKSKKNIKSIVNQITFDKEIDKTSTANGSFPLRPYSIYENGSIVNKKELNNGGYYPFLRRAILPNKNIDSKFYALNIVSDSDFIENLEFKMVKLDKNSIVFEHNSSNLKITKKYEFSTEAPYTFDMSLSLNTPYKNLWLSTGVPEVELTSGRNDPILKARILKNSKSSIEKLSLPKGINTITNIQPDWICNSNGFFGIIIDPLNETSAGFRSELVLGETLPTRLTLIDSKYSVYPAKKYPGYEMFLPLDLSKTQKTIRVYAGPLAKDTLIAVDETFSNAITGYNPEYVKSRSFHGILSFISEPFAKLMFILMQMFYTITHSWGFSIILLTLVLRIMLYPLNAWSIKSNLRMQELAPELKKLQKKYEKDPQKQKLEMVRLYKEKGVNPISMFFPILIQLPFLIGMFDLLKSTFELRGVPFIPGWIDSLTSPDVLVSWSYPVILIGNQLHILPIILGVTMYLQSKFMSKKTDKSEMDEKQKQMQSFSKFMPILFTFIFYNMPSGLNIYFLSSTIFGIIQQIYSNKMVAKKKI